MDPDTALLQLICSSRLPWSIVDNRYFRAFVQRLAGKKYKLPSQTALSGPLLDNLYSQILQNVSNAFNDVQHISLCVDGSVDEVGQRYNSVVACGLDSTFTLRSEIIGCFPMAKNPEAAHLAKLCCQVLTRCGIAESKVIAIVTHETSDIALHFSNAQSVLYSAHLLQTSLKHAFDAQATPLFRNVLSVCKRIVSEYNQSILARCEFPALQARLSESISGILQTSNRWLSHLDALQSVAKNERAVSTWLSSDAVFADSPVSIDTVFRVLERLVEILSPFRTAAVAFSAEKDATLNLPIEYFERLTVRLQGLKVKLGDAELSFDTKAAIMALLDSILEALTLKFKPWQPYQLAAYILDPCHRRRRNPTEENVALLHDCYNALEKLLLESLADVEIEPAPTEPVICDGCELILGVESPYAQAIAEINLYKRVWQEVTDTVATFWISKRSSLPLLFRLATKLFSIPCSQAPCEKHFYMLRSLIIPRYVEPEQKNKMLTIAASLRSDQAGTPSTSPLIHQELVDRINSLLLRNCGRELRTAIANFQTRNMAEFLKLNQTVTRDGSQARWKPRPIKVTPHGVTCPNLQISQSPWKKTSDRCR